MAFTVTSERWKCLRCRYVLKGLCGDPVRCPECGQLNTLHDLRELFDDNGSHGEVQISQIGYVFSTGGLILMLAGMIILCLERLGLVFLALGGLLWSGGLWYYRASCIDRRGIWTALLRFQGFFVLIVASLLGFATVWFFLGQLLARHYNISSLLSGALASVGTAIVLAAVLPLLRRLLRSFARAWSVILIKQGYE